MLKQPCLFFEGQSLARAGVLDVQVNISNIYFSSDTRGSHIFKCKFAFYLVGQDVTFGPVKLTMSVLANNQITGLWLILYASKTVRGQ